MLFSGLRYPLWKDCLIPYKGQDSQIGNCWSRPSALPIPFPVLPAGIPVPLTCRRSSWLCLPNLEITSKSHYVQLSKPDRQTVDQTSLKVRESEICLPLPSSAEIKSVHLDVSAPPPPILRKYLDPPSCWASLCAMCYTCLSVCLLFVYLTDNHLTKWANSYAQSVVASCSSTFLVHPCYDTLGWTALSCEPWELRCVSGALRPLVCYALPLSLLSPFQLL